MIIWLASYPKSGNTWIRFFINSLLYTEEGKGDLINIANIRAFPKPEQFINLVKNVNDIKEVSKNWTMAQRILNLDKKIKFIKTHNILCRLNGHHFTDLSNTLGVIYIVRDPRNIVTSIKYHFQLDTLENAKDFIIFENTINGDKNSDQNPMPSIIGSWKTHYNSWKKFPKNLLILNYDKILLNPKKEFLKVKKFLERILKFKINENKFNYTVENCKFEKLQEIEQSEGFIESVVDKNTGQKKKFFNMGPKNNWKTHIDKKIKDEIENNFREEMKELNYL
ncbi:MAG: hypothetical protein CBE27_000705 [Pelagibacteraceae bacterium TMED267]|nr:MAG: hypothetical protein CBE27_000705 [Pelagibacteraceae bacterium TMED267]|tara:strand:- start:1988 stop:2827 length:840 start_codon:yes stop_codon:yes gene_type:complete